MACRFGEMGKIVEAWSTFLKRLLVGWCVVMTNESPESAMLVLLESDRNELGLSSIDVLDSNRAERGTVCDAVSCGGGGSNCSLGTRAPSRPTAADTGLEHDGDEKQEDEVDEGPEEGVEDVLEELDVSCVREVNSSGKRGGG